MEKFISIIGERFIDFMADGGLLTLAYIPVYFVIQMHR